MKELGTTFQNLMPERRNLLSDLMAGLTFAVVKCHRLWGMRCWRRSIRCSGSTR